ncbi:4-hydroxy-tetrahydrodipicolinate synthase [Variovorax sp. J22P240]|uniref:4-hydroxy-tetrahydrodipicolinate synthase n=1 Tax=Variovorax sp. J22P240 TaxID=3053514 RepID=UPI002577D469|nr:4-hydroxy-tetrahydrodipicolinate synthase [Variovorax sp. J22P240]MDL9997133.1 4-hydroxy-tetrahydrodipicolinate synthase [Variovorax sp. J22P240]
MQDTLSPPPDFSGLWIPLVTPFRDEAIDHPALARLVEQLAPTGIAGFVVCGSTGESAALDSDEQLAVLDTVARTARSLPRIMGISGYHLGKTREWVRRLADRELAGLLVPAPSYIRPSQAGLIDWFSEIAGAGAVPLLIYDIPYRTGSTLTRETLLALADHPLIRAIKDCGGDAGKTRALIADGRLQVLAGEDAQMFSTVAEGGAGAIAASAHLQTERFVKVLRLLREGSLADARAQWQPLLPLIEALFSDANPGPLKAILANEGLMQDDLRAPMTRASDELRERLLEIQAALSRP